MEGIIEEFMKGFTDYLESNPNEQEIFTEAWFNADNRTIKDILNDYVDGLEVQNYGG